MAQTITPVVSAAPRPDPVVAELLQSVVDTARAIFGAQASSIMLLDPAADELIFEAVSGQGQEFLVGRRFPAGRGIAGWVAASGEPMVVDDLHDSVSFDRAIAESTGYVPNALMAAPSSAGTGSSASWRCSIRPRRPAPACRSSTCWASSPVRPPSPCTS